jgi:hypothetical protein
MGVAVLQLSLAGGEKQEMLAAQPTLLLVFAALLDVKRTVRQPFVDEKVRAAELHALQVYTSGDATVDPL